MLSQMILLNLPNVTSSPGSVDGPTRCILQTGRQADQSGQEVARVNLSARQAKERELLTLVTSGPRSFGLSASATLQLHLGSKLREMLDANGSLEYVLTWKHWDMVWGQPICALRARARRISDSGYSGWPTPTATDSVKRGKVSPRPGAMGLSETVPLSGWPTPRVGNGGYGHPTPTSRDHKDGRQCNVSTNSLLGRVVWGCGKTMKSSDVQKGERGVLNPEFTRWLQGYPEEWSLSEDTGMQLSRK